MDSRPRIMYAAAIRLPTEKAHGAQIMHTCEALAVLGCDLTLVIPGRATPLTEDPFDYYRVQHNFALVQRSVPDWFPLGRVGFFLASLLFAARVAQYARRAPPQCLYSRDRTLLCALSVFVPRLPLVWEVHGEEPSWAVRWLGRRARIVAISQGIKDELVARGVSAERVCVAPDGVDLAPFETPEPRAAARARLGLPAEQTIAMYIGRLDGWKGVDTLLEASALLPADVLVAIIGGETQQVERLSAAYPRVRFLGQRPYAQVADNQAAADVLVLPNTARDETSARFTSPLKLFTYMASGIPIVASDLPSLREVLKDDMAMFVEPDNPKALAAGIARVCNDRAEAQRRAARARARVVAYSWSERAKTILACIRAPEAAAPRSGHSQFIKYIVSGCTAACVNIGLLYALTEFAGLYYLFSATLSFLAALLVSFSLQKFWTFQNRETGRIHHQLLTFALVAVCNLVSNITLLYVCTEWLHLWYIAGEVLVTGALAVVTFFIYRVIFL